MPEPSSGMTADVARALGLSSNATISPAPQGMTAEVAFVDDGGRWYVLKRCRDPIYIDWLRREHEVLRALADHSLPIPRMLGYHEVRQHHQVVDAWLLMTRLPGVSLWDVMLNAAPDQRTRHFHTLGALIHDIHSTAPPPILCAHATWIERRLEHARNNLPWCDGSLELLLQLDMARPAPHPETLIHGDLALDNVIIGEDGSLGLIDWSGGDVGDPRYDLSLALATEPELQLRDADVMALFEGYGGTPLDAATRRWFVDLYEFF